MIPSDPFEGLPLEQPGPVGGWVLDHPRAAVLLAVCFALAVALIVVRPWDFVRG